MNATTDASIRFREVQSAKQWWLWVITVGVAVLGWWAFVQQIVLGQPFGSNPAPNIAVWIIWAATGVAIPLMIASMRLKITVDDEKLDWSYRPFMQRTIPLRDIESATARTYRPIAEYLGWGIRWTPPRGWAITISGNRGVQLELRSGRSVLLGSNRAQELESAIRAELDAE